MSRYRGQTPLPDHRIFDGFLRRVAADPEVEAFALRGGMLVRHWFPDMGRAAADVDLVCAWPFEPQAVRRSLATILARDLGDGVRFGDRFRTDVIWAGTAHPGLRLVAAGCAGGVWGELHADLTFRLPVWPEARITTLRAAGTGPTLPVCRPETLIARKLAVTAERGAKAWRPKDLADLWWMLQHGAIERAAVGESIERTLSLQRFGDGPARLAFWQEPAAAGSWARFVRRQPQLAVPRDLARVVGDVRAQLAFLGAEASCR